MIYFGKVFTSTVVGSRFVNTTCEKCGAPYGYELTRVGVGRGRSPYMIDQEGAQRRAAAAAQRVLARRLEAELDPVPCPACNWVSVGAVEQYRGRLYRGATALAVAIGVIGGLSALITWAAMDDNYPPGSHAPADVGVVVAMGSALLVVVVLLGRRHLRLRVDPNATYPRRPTPLPGTPPALVVGRDPSTGQAAWVRAESPAGADRPLPVDWVTFRPGQLRMPAVCGVCLGTPTTVYRAPMPIDKGADLNVPLCGPCDGRCRRRWWVVCLAVAVGGAAVAIAPAWLYPSKALPGLPICVSVFAPLGSLVAGVVIAGRFARPYNLVTIDAGRGVYRFSADNPAYTARVAAAVRASGPPAAPPFDGRRSPSYSPPDA
jgi:hypothetical protein